MPGTQRRNWKAELLSIPGSITSDWRSQRCKEAEWESRGCGLLTGVFTAHLSLLSSTVQDHFA